MLNANFGYQIQMTVNLTVEILPTEKRSIRDNGLQAQLMIEWGAFLPSDLPSFVSDTQN